MSVIISPRYMEFARAWAATAGLDPLELIRIVGDTTTVDATDDEIVMIVNAAYEGGWRALKRAADGWAAHDERVSCYTARGEDGRPEAVHERRSNGACACGAFKARV